MNRDRAKELLPVIEAFANGEEIEFQMVGHGNDEWQPLISDDWNLQHGTVTHHYRIKPKAREWWVAWDGECEGQMYAFPYPEYSEHCVDHWENYVKVREVL